MTLKEKLSTTAAKYQPPYFDTFQKIDELKNELDDIMEHMFPGKQLRLLVLPHTIPKIINEAEIEWILINVEVVPASVIKSGLSQIPLIYYFKREIN